LLSFIAIKIKLITFAVMVAKEYLQGSLTNIRNNLGGPVSLLDQKVKTLNDAKGQKAVLVSKIR
jgi:hypothetical protein